MAALLSATRSCGMAIVGANRLAPAKEAGTGAADRVALDATGEADTGEATAGDVLVLAGNGVPPPSHCASAVVPKAMTDTIPIIIAKRIFVPFHCVTESPEQASALPW